MRRGSLEMREKIKNAVLRGAYSSGLHRIISHLAGGAGTVLMLHRVVETKEETPSRYLTVTSSFLDEVIFTIKKNNMIFVSLDEMLSILRSRRTSRHRFVALTFDDGYRDNLTLALPILRSHGIPFAVFVPSGAPDRSMDVWFLRLERILMQLSCAEIGSGRNRRTLRLESPAQKAIAYEYCIHLAQQDLSAFKLWLNDLLPESAVGSFDLMNEHFLSWDELRELSVDPLVTIGGHTVSHPMLARLPQDEAYHEIEAGRDRLASALGKPILHFAYPFGDPLACGARDFELAKRAGFESAVTTRYGNIYRWHRQHLHSLPRMTLGGPAERIADTLLDVSGTRTFFSRKCFAPPATA